MECCVQIKKVNKTRSVVGVMIYHVPIGNDFLFEVKTLKKQGKDRFCRIVKSPLKILKLYNFQEVNTDICHTQYCQCHFVTL